MGKNGWLWERGREGHLKMEEQRNLLAAITRRKYNQHTRTHTSTKHWHTTSHFFMQHVALRYDCDATVWSKEEKRGVRTSAPKLMVHTADQAMLPEICRSFIGLDRRLPQLPSNRKQKTKQRRKHFLQCHTRTHAQDNELAKASRIRNHPRDRSGPSIQQRDHLRTK